MNSQDLEMLYQTTGEDLLFAVGDLLVPGRGPAPYITSTTRISPARSWKSSARRSAGPGAADQHAGPLLLVADPTANRSGDASGRLRLGAQTLG